MSGSRATSQKQHEDQTAKLIIFFRNSNVLQSLWQSLHDTEPGTSLLACPVPAAAELARGSGAEALCTHGCHRDVAVPLRQARG